MESLMTTGRFSIAPRPKIPTLGWLITGSPNNPPKTPGLVIEKVLSCTSSGFNFFERARSKKLKPEEVQESTFSITNPGVFGGLFGLPVISQPNVGILGLGAIEKRPVVINDSIAIRSMCYVTLSYDHRVVDGAIAHQFLHKVKETLENWAEPVL